MEDSAEPLERKTPRIPEPRFEKAGRISRSVEIVDDRSGLHQPLEPVLLHVLSDHAVGQVVQKGLDSQVFGQPLHDVAVEGVHAAGEVLAVMQEQLAARAEPHRGGGVETRVAGDVDAAVDHETDRVHAVVDALRGIRDVLGEEGLHPDAADVLLPRVHPETVELHGRHEVEEVAGEHLALGAVQVDFLAEREPAAQGPAPESLGIAVRDIEVGAELPAIPRRQDPGHVHAHFLVLALGRFLDERRLIAPLQCQFLDTTAVVGMRVRDDEMLHVVHREAELGHLVRRLRAEIDEQRRVPLHDDEITLKHLGGEGGPDAERHHSQLAVLGGERQLVLIAPHADAGSDELGSICAEIQFRSLE